MKLSRLRLFTFLLGIVATANDVAAQDARTPHFFGINPSVTVEPFYEKGELDVNVFPAVYQRPLSRRVDLRLSTILNLGIRNQGNSINHLGVEGAVPVFLTPKETKFEASKGWFLAPVVNLSRNRIEKHNNLGLWIEPGYHLLFDNRFALSLGLQVGGTYFRYDAGEKKWGNHFGIKVILGRWV